MNWSEITIDALGGALGVSAASYALAAIGLNLQFGFTGLMNFGLVASVAAGAYGAAIPIENGAPMWVGILCGLAASVALGIISGFTALRLQLDYLAMATLAMGEFLRFMLRSNWAHPLTNSVYGITQVGEDFFALNPFDPASDIGIGDLSYKGRAFWVMIVCWSLAIIGTLIIYLMIKSPWGRAIKAVREDEYAARSLGKNVFALRMQSFVVGGIFGSLAGIILAFDQNVNPQFYVVQFTFYVYAAMLIGGPGTIMGPIFGAIVFWFAFEWFEGFVSGLINLGWFSFNDVHLLNTGDESAVRYMFVGLVFVLLVVYRPQGLFGKKEEELLSES